MAKEVGGETTNESVDSFFERVFSEQRERRFINAQYRFLTHGFDDDDIFDYIVDRIKSLDK
jgi:hypothetical protein